MVRHNEIDRSNEIDVLTAIGAAGATHFVERDGDRDCELNPGARWRQVDCKMRAFITRDTLLALINFQLRLRGHQFWTRIYCIVPPHQMVRRPLWVISGHSGHQSPCPLYPRKRTLGREARSSPQSPAQAEYSWQRHRAFHQATLDHRQLAHLRRRDDDVRCKTDQIRAAWATGDRISALRIAAWFFDRSADT
jgi:hypothetical protein